MMRIGSLFTGYSGLDLAVEAWFGARTVWTADIDPGASKIIAHRYPDAPNHGDITAVDWTTAEPIDILTGGWPCQPWSNAGKRLGEADERALWPQVVRAVRVLRPRHVFLENVSAIARAGELARAVRDLALLGYVGSWIRLRAADVGAPHGRSRIFIVARDTHDQYPASLGSVSARQDAEPGGGAVQDADRSAGGQRWIAASRQAEGGRPRADARGRGGVPAANAQCFGEPGRGVVRDLGRASANREGEAREQRNRYAADDRRAATPDALGRGRARRAPEPLREPVGRATPARSGEVDWGTYGPAVHRWEHVLGRVAPAPTETGPKGGQRLSPAFVEWMMGLPAGWVTDVPDLSRNAQLKALGNGVVPQQAYEALRRLLPVEALGGAA